jgi:class 3 adenylate cyclase
MQRAFAQVNQRRTPAEQILLCIGLGFGRVLRIGDEDVWGKEVNSASRLGEDTARPGEVLLTAAARLALSGRRDEEFQALAESPLVDEVTFRFVPRAP